MEPLEFVGRSILPALVMWLAAPCLAQVQVNLFNDARVEAGTLERARQEADRILDSAGVHVEWCDCKPSKSFDEACFPSGPGTLQLRLLSAEAEAKFRGIAYGFALPKKSPVFGLFAAVFPSRVFGLSTRNKIDAGMVMGHVIVHEIGHLLLGANEHAVDGIMKAGWEMEDLRRLRCGTLLFLPKQAEIMRRNVDERRAEQLAMRHGQSQTVGSVPRDRQGNNDSGVPANDSSIRTSSIAFAPSTPGK